MFEFDKKNEDNPEYFKCPFCKSLILRSNAIKHLKNQHQDTHTIHKYVSCTVCQALVLKHKYTPHLRSKHGINSQKGFKPKKGKKQ